ncbi:dnaJ [Symbiodinium sp. KB8]|nr:dnaJ [Symbiodinium sp. KB8]
MTSEESGAAEASADEVSMLRTEVGKLAQEMLMHRQVLEQCLEVRESVLELLQHRESLVQCLELREGVQAALSSTQIIGEVVDRTSELDLSLAGVSDNTARHGRAIASLTEQQRRTSDTLDAVVRAVKRLDRSRSRQRGVARQAGSSAPSERAASTRSMPFYERQGEGMDEEERHALALAWAGSALADGTRPCGLAAMQLRSTDHAVDLQPRFSPEEFSYSATLDFSMETFSIDAEPEAGCEVGGLPNRPFLAPSVEKGGNPKESNICARDPATGAEQWYRVSVAKLSGAETEIAGMRVRGGELVPGFRPQQRLYQVQLDVSHDFVEVDFVLQDNGQKVLWKATPEVRRQGLNSQSSIVRALVMETGEQQHHQRHEVFPLDVGFSRQLSLHIESADPMKAAQGIYTINVTRGGCSKQRPLYNPQSGSCHIECPQGMYPNQEASRCSYCNRNCAVCGSFSVCDRCFQDTVDTSYVLDQSDGSCTEVHGHATSISPQLSSRSGAASSRSITGGASPDRSSAGSSSACVWSLSVSG